jgi:hypothetical protein
LDLRRVDFGPEQNSGRFFHRSHLCIEGALGDLVGAAGNVLDGLHLRFFIELGLKLEAKRQSKGFWSAD